jgi:hypothetical protein
MCSGIRPLIGCSSVDIRLLVSEGRGVLAKLAASIASAVKYCIFKWAICIATDAKYSSALQFTRLKLKPPASGQRDPANAPAPAVGASPVKSGACQKTSRQKINYQKQEIG